MNEYFVYPRKINLQCKVDTGAQSNVLPIRLLRIIAPGKFDDKGNLKPEALEKNGAVLSAYGGFIIKQLGTINIPCKYKERKINCIFYVTDTSGPAILGLKAYIALKVVSYSVHSTASMLQLKIQALVGKVRITSKVMYHWKSGHQSVVNKT